MRSLTVFGIFLTFLAFLVTSRAATVDLTDFLRDWSTKRLYAINIIKKHTCDSEQLYFPQIVSPLLKKIRKNYEDQFENKEGFLDLIENISRAFEARFPSNGIEHEGNKTTQTNEIKRLVTALFNQIKNLQLESGNSKGSESDSDSHSAHESEEGSLEETLSQSSKDGESDPEVVFLGVSNFESREILTGDGEDVIQLWSESDSDSINPSEKGSLDAASSNSFTQSSFLGLGTLKKGSKHVRNEKLARPSSCMRSLSQGFDPTSRSNSTVDGTEESTLKPDNRKRINSEKGVKPIKSNKSDVIHDKSMIGSEGKTKKIASTASVKTVSGGKWKVTLIWTSVAVFIILMLAAGGYFVYFRFFKSFI